MNKSKNSDKLGQRLQRISADIKLYIEKRLELVMLNAGEYISGWMAASVQRTAGVLLLLGGVCFLLVALAIYLGDLLGSESLGFVLVSLPLLFSGLLFVYLKPEAMRDRLEQLFEAEVIKAVNETKESKQKKLEATDLNRSNTEKDN
ncbi:hypothetical protein LX73_0819 [Fodinibius salinus]|uniref:Holin-X, holin superfamily III n=1 Tax=Fodinibius salinus TaxID=860790 RepID=A0A5D3YP81_9BACT|nr:hypothetical protein [Fodinibius salinus]TYP95512.1 hypothetical protein LX73_0819 [Fodinibius salinus]